MFAGAKKTTQHKREIEHMSARDNARSGLVCQSRLVRACGPSSERCALSPAPYDLSSSKGALRQAQCACHRSGVVWPTRLVRTWMRPRRLAATCEPAVPICRLTLSNPARSAESGGQRSAWAHDPESHASGPSIPGARIGIARRPLAPIVQSKGRNYR